MIILYYYHTSITVIPNGSFLFWCKFWVTSTLGSWRHRLSTGRSTFDTSLFAAAIELDGMVLERFPVGDSREFFDTGLKYLNKLIENTCLIQNTKIFESNISWYTMCYQNSQKYYLTKNWSHMVYSFTFATPSRTRMLVLINIPKNFAALSCFLAHYFSCFSCSFSLSFLWLLFPSFIRISWQI